jgi:predicted transglutaminase-like cysteine proteinase
MSRVLLACAVRRTLVRALLLGLALGLSLGLAGTAPLWAADATTPKAKVQLAVVTPGLFGTAEIRSSRLQAFPKWRGLMARVRKEAPQWRSTPRLRAWQDFLATLRGHDREYQINAVNTYVNQQLYILDPQNYGKKDYWATPGEFFANGGDCEDYATVKYFSLKQLGIDPKRMRVVVLHDTNLNIAHAVLEVQQPGQRLILDNQLQIVVAAERITHYKPHYSINESYWWLHKPGKPGQQPDTLSVTASAQ